MAGGFKKMWLENLHQYPLKLLFELYLIGKGIKYEKNYVVIGTDGWRYHYDFVFPSKTHEPSTTEHPSTTPHHEDNLETSNEDTFCSAENNIIKDVTAIKKQKESSAKKERYIGVVVKDWRRALGVDTIIYFERAIKASPTIERGILVYTMISLAADSLAKRINLLTLSRDELLQILTSAKIKLKIEEYFTEQGNLLSLLSFEDVFSPVSGSQRR